MDSNNIETARTQAKRRVRTNAVVLVLTCAAFINVTKKSNIRIVEILPILACGIALGAFIVNLIMMWRINKQKINS